MPNRPKAYTRHQSRLDAITAVIKYYALIGVNEKLPTCLRTIDQRILLKYIEF